MLHRRCYMVVVIVIKFRFVIQGKDIKKNLNSITDLLFDMGDPSDDDSARLTKDLKSHEKKIKALAKQPPIYTNNMCTHLPLPTQPRITLPRFHTLDPSSDVEQMDTLCEEIHEEVAWDSVVFSCSMGYRRLPKD